MRLLHRAAERGVDILLGVIRLHAEQRERIGERHLHDRRTPPDACP
jgi:hypothetical protein